MRKAKYVSELKRYVKSSSGNGSRDVTSGVPQNDTSHTALTKNVTSHVTHGTKPPPNASALM